MTEKISDRVAKAIEKSPFSDADIGSSIGVAPSTVWRWRKGNTKRFSERDLKALAKKIHVNYEWLQFGKGSMSDDPAIQEIGNRVAEKGESYKGLDQTLSTVESKAKSLVRDLQSLLNDLEDLKK